MNNWCKSPTKVSTLYVPSFSSIWSKYSHFIANFYNVCKKEIENEETLVAYILKMAGVIFFKFGVKTLYMRELLSKIR